MKQYRNKVWFHYAMLAFGLLCIGWSAIFVKLADVGGVPSAFYRMFIGSLAILPIWWFRRSSQKTTRAGIRAAALCGFFFACDIAMWNTSILLSKAAIATLLANLSPVWVGLGAYFMFKEKPGRIYWIGTFIALAGVSVIVGPASIYDSGLSSGSLLAICASIFYAAYLLTTQRVRGNLDTITFTAVSMFSSTLVLFIFGLIGNDPLLGYSFKSWMSLLGLGIVSQFLGWIAINWSLGYIKSTAASVTLLSQSIVTALIAVPLLHEYLRFSEIIGAVIVLAGIFLVNRRNLK